MKIFYIEDESGDCFSTDKTRRFRRIAGKEAVKYLRDERKRGIYRRFLRTETEEIDGDLHYDEVYVEIPHDRVGVFRAAERRKQYVSQCKEKAGIETVSLSAPLSDQEELTVEDTLSDSMRSVEDDALHEIELEILRRALKTLSDDELQLIHELYLSQDPVSLRELSRRLGVSLTTLEYRKQQILKKLKNK